MHKRFLSSSCRNTTGEEKLVAVSALTKDKKWLNGIFQWVVNRSKLDDNIFARDNEKGHKKRKAACHGRGHVQ